MNNMNSPYNATLTGCGFAFYEFERVLPLLMSEGSAALLKQEVEENNLMMVNSQTARSRFMTEFRKRYAAVPAYFWTIWQNWSEEGRRAGLLYAIIKCYKIVFDFHFNATIKEWNSIDHALDSSDVMMVLTDICSRDSFVDGWSDQTKSKIVSQYLTILRQAGMLDGNGELQPIKLEDSEYEYYLRSGEDWFLEACLLYPYEINDIKSRMQ